MVYNLDFTSNVSRVAFVCLIYVLATSGYITQFISCQMKTFIQSNSYVKHILAIILIFAYIMFEGGWDLDKSREDQEPNNWASGNTYHTMLIAFIIYFIFIISSKSRKIPNIIFFCSLFILYIINTYREYIFIRKEIEEPTNNNIIMFEKAISIFAFIVFIIGFIDYYLYQKREHPKDFSNFKFIVGTDNCNSEIKFTDTINTMTQAIKNINNENKDEITKALENIFNAINNNQLLLNFVKKLI